MISHPLRPLLAKFKAVKGMGGTPIVTSNLRENVPVNALFPKILVKNWKISACKREGGSETNIVTCDLESNLAQKAWGTN